jgi:hypothetical protein
LVTTQQFQFRDHTRCNLWAAQQLHCTPQHSATNTRNTQAMTEFEFGGPVAGPVGIIVGLPVIIYALCQLHKPNPHTKQIMKT